MYRCAMPSILSLSVLNGQLRKQNRFLKLTQWLEKCQVLKVFAGEWTFSGFSCGCDNVVDIFLPMVKY